MEDKVDWTYREGIAKHGEETKRLLRKGAECIMTKILDSREEKGPCSWSRKEMWEKVWFLGNKAQWLEKQMKEAKDKVQQLEMAVVSAKTEHGLAQGRRLPSRKGKEKAVRTRLLWTSWEND